MGLVADLPLFIWLSPAFPVGAFAYSHGLETAVDEGLVSDVDTLRDWIFDLLTQGSIRQDTVLLAEAYRAAHARQPERLAEVNDLALALCAGRERRLETGAMGTAFVAALRATWPDSLPDDLAGDVAYPVAVGAAAGTEELDLVATVAAYAMAFVATLVSAAVRLGPVGQTDGQRVTAAMLEPARALADAAARSSLDDLGACAFGSDLSALRHETLYSRLFRS